MGRVDGKVALITGAGGGIGRATSQRLAEEGATIIATDFNETLGQQTVDIITQAGGAARFMPHDVTVENAWEEVMESILAQEGKLDILVNNAGIILLRPIDEFPLEDFRRQNAVNIDGVFLGLKHGIRAMKEVGTGSIINLSSVAGLTGSPLAVGYCATKGAVRLMTKAAAKEMMARRLNIRVNSVHPGMIETSMAQDIRDQMGDGEAMDRGIKRAQGRFGVPEEVANGILYLASDDSSFTNGSELVLDNAQTA